MIGVIGGLVLVAYLGAVLLLIHIDLRKDER